MARKSEQPVSDAQREAELRRKREMACIEVINKTLEDYKCILSSVCPIGEVSYPVEAILRLPVAINVMSR